MDLILKKGLAARNLDERAVEGLHSPDDFIKWEWLALSKGVWRIAPDTPRIAHRKPHKNARQTGESRFTLNAAIDLVNEQRAGGLVAKRRQTVGVLERSRCH